MLTNVGIYAGKKRRKPVQKPKKPAGADGVVKSNPSKRHRDRLNGELDRLTDLLPFPEEVRSRLDKLSVLRLSVGYLKAKSFFKATMKKNSLMFPSGNGLNSNGMDIAGFSEGDLLLQALNGFVMVVTGEGLVFYASPTIQEYLGFHQSDVVHQSVYELIHTDDRALFKQQLHFALNPKPFIQDQVSNGLQSDTLNCDPEYLPPENSSFLERSFVCRFRCLLDNSSGFLALNFQGRLKYLHGQKTMCDDGTQLKPQLALFTIATPVQPPSILEIRAKMVIFQTKHKLDFTPLGIDTRGKVVLGYSEIELCMRGSGYQFIHAADMMYCADKHFRMIKTGETGLTVFRLLTKSDGWVWVQSNARLIYKGGRPDFIIARQRALLNTEGEEHLRQRKLKVPFSLTTGEALLYETEISLDDVQHKPHSSVPKIPKDQKEKHPQSLLECFLKQDHNIYTKNEEHQLSEDQMFMESRALVNVACNSWKDIDSNANKGSAVTVKDEGDESVIAMIDALGKMAQDGELCAALQGLEVDAEELMELENTLQSLSQSNDGNNTKAELESILTNDVFAFMENVLFKESSEGHQNASEPSCLGTVNNNQGEAFAHVLPPSNAGLCDAQLLQRHNFHQSPVNGLCAKFQNPNNAPVVMTAQGVAGSSPVFNSTQKLSHYGPLIASPDMHTSSPQQLQVQDTYSPSIGLPELNIPDNSGRSASSVFGSCGQAPINHMGEQGISGQQQTNQPLLQYPHNGMQTPMAAGEQLYSSVQQSSNVAPSIAETLPSLIPCNGFSSPIESSTHLPPSPFPTTCLQGNSSFQPHNNLRVHQWPQDQQQKLPSACAMQNGHNFMPACNGQVSEGQRLPPAGHWQQKSSGLNHNLQGGLVNDQHAHPSSCMFAKNLVALPNSSHVDGSRLTPSTSSCQRTSNGHLDQSPPQGSCYFQWGHSEPVVGTSAIVQENASISPQAHQLLSKASLPEDMLAMQHYLECNRQTQIPAIPAENNSLFSIPPLVDGNMYFPESTQTNCCNF